MEIEKNDMVMVYDGGGTAKDEAVWKKQACPVCGNR